MKTTSREKDGELEKNEKRMYERTNENVFCIPYLFAGCFFFIRFIFMAMQQFMYLYIYVHIYI